MNFIVRISFLPWIFFSVFLTCCVTGPVEKDQNYYYEEGMKAYDAENHEFALKYFQNGVEIAEREGDRRMQGRLILNIGIVNEKLDLDDEAISYYEKALKIFRDINDKPLEGKALNNMGIYYDEKGLYDKALSYYEEALAICSKINDRTGEADILLNLGLMHHNMKKYDKALSCYEQSLAIYRNIDNRLAEGRTINNIGLLHYHTGQYEKAIDFYEQALAINREIGDQKLEKAGFFNIGLCHLSKRQYEKAIIYFEQALEINRKAGDRKYEISGFLNIGLCNLNLGKYEKAIEYLEQAQAISSKTGDRANEAYILQNIGNAYYEIKKYDWAITNFEKSRTLYFEIGDRYGERFAIYKISVIYSAIGQHEKAIDHYKYVVEICRDIGDLSGEANVLLEIGNVYYQMKKPDRAHSCYEQSLEIYREIGLQSGERNALYNIGIIYYDTGQYEKAIEYYEKARLIDREVGYRIGERDSIQSIGNAYYSLTKYETALSYYEQSLEISREVGDRAAIATNMVNIGNVHYNNRKYEKAISNQNQALKIFSEIGDQRNEGATLYNIGNAYYGLKKFETALSFYDQSLAISVKIGDRIGERETLIQIGMVYREGISKKKAESYFEKALTIAREVGNQETEAKLLVDIGDIYWDAQHSFHMSANKVEILMNALKSYKQALVIFREIGDRNRERKTLTDIGKIFQDLEIKKFEEALRCYEEALVIARELDSTDSEVLHYLLNIGDLLQILGQSKRSLYYCNQALSISKQSGDLDGEWESLNCHSFAYYDLEEYEKAMAFADQADAIWEEIDRDIQADIKSTKSSRQKNYSCIWPNTDPTVETYCKEAKKHYEEGRYNDALYTWQRALTHAEEIFKYNKGPQLSILTKIADLYDLLGQYGNMLAVYEKSFEIAREITFTDRHEIKYLQIMGRVYNDLGKYDKALACYEQAMAMSKKSGTLSYGMVDFLISIGNVYMNMGQYEKALSYYLEALPMRINTESEAEKAANSPQKATIILNIGVAYYNIGQYEKALSHFEQALAIHDDIVDNYGEALALNNIGSMYAEGQQQHEKALPYFEKAMEIARKIGNRRLEGLFLTNIGESYNEIGEHKKALDYCMHALDALRETDDQRNTAIIHKVIGIAYSKLGQYDKAHHHLTKSLEIANRISSPSLIYTVMRNLADIEVKMKRYTEAVSHYEQALDIIESLREQLTQKEFRISFMQDKLGIYDEFIELLGTLHHKFPGKGYDRKSFEIFERKQGRVFLEEMGKSGARYFAGLPKTLSRRETELEKQLAKIQAEIANEQRKPSRFWERERINSLKASQAELKTEKEKLVQEIKAKYPDYHALKYPKPVSMAEVQKTVLQPGEAMLLYGMSEKKTYLWVVTQNGFGLFPLADGETSLQDKVEAFRRGPDAVIRAIQKGATESKLERTLHRAQRRITQAARELYETLMPEQARRMITGVRTLYVIPTGPLYSLPFEALVTQIDDSQVPRYLIEDHAVVYLSSASLLKTIRSAQKRRKERPKYPLLAFAHPVYENAVQTESKQKSIQTKGVATVTSLRGGAYLDLMGGGFAELPETEAEAREIMAILKAPETSGPLQLRQNASRSTVLALNQSGKLDDYRYVVFSCHGILPGEIDRVTQPALVLSNPDPQSNTDGFLTMADVFGIKLNADMVTLSACNTGRGKAEKGEGVRGLTRAFMYAGTPAISVTLWSVESQSAKQLSTGLYRNLKLGKNRSEALRQIKLRMIRGETGTLFQHPFFWAPVVIFGDGGGRTH